MPATLPQLDIDSPYKLSSDQIESFRARGFVKLKEVLSSEVLAHYGEEITTKMLQFNKNIKPMEERNTYDKAFIQVGNLWEKSEVAKQFCFGKRLARIATELLGVTGVRMWHDQALYKEPSGGFTPWHADQYYWPMATEMSVTAWIPLQETPLEMGPLAFAERSHTFECGRELKISDESEKEIERNMQEQGFPYIEQPFDLGEVSFHYGWTFHRAGPNTTTTPRKVMTIIYMDEMMRLKKPTNDNQMNDWRVWCNEAKIGEIIQTPKNPVIFSFNQK